MGLVPQNLQKIVDDLQPILKQIVADKEVRTDLDIVLDAITSEFQSASGNATDKTLKGIFNNVAGVMPFFRKMLEKGKPSVWDTAKNVPTLLNLYNNRSNLQTAFKNPGVELNAIYDKLLENAEMQGALERILNKPVGQDVFKLLQEDGKYYAVEKLTSNDIRFPLPAASYDRVKKLWDNGQNPPAPKGPGF